MILQTQDSVSEYFINALLSEDLNAIKKIPKSDLHCHVKYGGTRQYFRDLGIFIPKMPSSISSIEEMQEWQTKYVTTRFRNSFEMIRATFVQAMKDTVMNMTIAISAHSALRTNVVSVINILHEKYIPNSKLSLDLILDKARDPFYDLNEIYELIDSGIFSGIDCGGMPEFEGINRFIPIYRYANNKSLVLKAHIGEFSSAEEMIRTIEMLELQEVNHGIAAVESANAISYLVRNNIRLNICPASNIRLNIVKKYSNHPISTLYHSGVDVTINTDDLLLFDDSISEQYLKLYQSGCLNPIELDRIRLSGLRNIKGE